MVVLVNETGRFLVSAVVTLQPPLFSLCFFSIPLCIQILKPRLGGSSSLRCLTDLRLVEPAEVITMAH